MARSYKRPWIKDRNPAAKRYANRRLRRICVEEDTGNGKWYRKYTDPWTISDWKWQARTPAETLRRYATDQWLYGYVVSWEPDPIQVMREYVKQFGNKRAKRGRR